MTIPRNPIKWKSQMSVVFGVILSGILSSCGASQLSEGGRSRRDLRGESGQNANFIELSGQHDLANQPEEECSGAQLTDGYGDKTSPKKTPGYGSPGKNPCPPPPPKPAPVPPAPPPAPGQTPAGTLNQFPLSLLTGLVCVKSPKELYNLAQFVGSQSKDQFQYLINSGVTGGLTLDQLVIYGQIAKSLTELQITDWKTRVCVGSQPIAECRLPPSGGVPDSFSKCLPIPPQAGKLEDGAGQTLSPPPALDDSGKGNT